MANTPQARKRIRRNENRAAINGARLSRIRTFVKKVESAIEGGDKSAAADAEGGAARTGARRGTRRAAQEHGCPQSIAPVEARRGALIRTRIGTGAEP